MTLDDLTYVTDGKTYHLYEIKYKFAGKDMAFYIYAQDDAEAEKILKNIQVYGKVGGKVGEGVKN